MHGNSSLWAGDCEADVLAMSLGITVATLLHVPDGAVVNSLYGSQLVERNAVVYSIIGTGKHWQAASQGTAVSQEGVGIVAEL